MSVCIYIYTYRVLNVIDIWVTIQYVDFKNNAELRAKLIQFLFNEYNTAPQALRERIDKIQSTLNQNADLFKDKLRQQALLFYQMYHRDRQLSALTYYSNSSKLIIPTMNHFNFHLPFVHTAAAASSATVEECSTTIPMSMPHFSTDMDTFLIMDAKDIARYLTLADYYLFKCILYSNELIQPKDTKDKSIPTFTEIMTKRANMVCFF
ncbi:hypothetical protein BDF20DRAFT_76880 [Mycotypha africana]|uniref:uncharacterized protein n=1 Tax=Mycotypha africana TaxID=64632 RepID=UPI0023007AB2|nr:uncharacterized protein BDF20DRAFT_76880 [Mycotypha africana]KAI8991938.1 hypothetical protein BDF20DRAFT_76880 [Mycotypha africana]